MIHSFNVEVAKEHGFEAAVILHFLCFWCMKNQANEKHMHDGVAWTYNSSVAFQELFPYLTRHKVRKAMEVLEEAKLILSGNYNQVKYDRTKWYAVTANGFVKNESSIVQNSPMHCSNSTNGSVGNHQPIPVNNTVHYSVDKPDNGEGNQKETKISPEIKEFVSKFQKHVLSIHGIKAPKITESLLNSGQDVVDKLIRLDGFKLDQIRDSLRWAVTDDFWSKNVLSLGSLRKKSKNNDLTKMQNIYASWENKTGGSAGPSNVPAYVGDMNLYGESN
ncbi:hypothetical protein [Desulfovibrio gilichinskyi]|uniref:Phage replication protein O n=1 Tax=Desulfovibrio gilichinskyi TaxID=1519643 RepID=A0A1X7C3F3_9BACT|nr:hypothetical protein [Desulfovibrio gilichinskyi]SME89288.1 hypothetical protein SAMN06295933_0265 [Desulfovibrio gilichinskyi]